MNARVTPVRTGLNALIQSMTTHVSVTPVIKVSVNVCLFGSLISVINPKQYNKKCRYQPQIWKYSTSSVPYLSATCKFFQLGWECYLFKEVVNEIYFSGKTCSMQDCLPQSCVEGATCMALSNGSITCLCPVGLGGSHCNITVGRDQFSR